MRRRKPDLLVVLAILIAFGVVLTGMTHAGGRDQLAAELKAYEGSVSVFSSEDSK